MSDSSKKPDKVEQLEAMLTAYALGQLDEQQCAKVEAILERSEKARRIVDETQSLANHLVEANRQGYSLKPSSNLREAVLNRCHQMEDPIMTPSETNPAGKNSAWKSRMFATVAIAGHQISLSDREKIT